MVEEVDEDDGFVGLIEDGGPPKRSNELDVAAALGVLQNYALYVTDSNRAVLQSSIRAIQRISDYE